jgi:chromosome segregation ATPase
MKERACRLSLLLWLVCCVVWPVSGQDTEHVELLPDGSVILSPQALNDIDSNLTLLESNSMRQEKLLMNLNSELNQATLSLTKLDGLYNEQRQLAGSLNSELSQATSSLMTFRVLYNEQASLVEKLKIQWNLIGERLELSDQSLAWAMEDAALMEGELATARAANQRLDRSARVWRVVAIVAGCLAVGAGVAAVVW